MNKSTLPKCSKCACEYVYESQDIYVCPECFYEWPINQLETKNDQDENTEIKDANGIIPDIYRNFIKKALKIYQNLELKKIVNKL